MNAPLDSFRPSMFHLTCGGTRFSLQYTQSLRSTQRGTSIRLMLSRWSLLLVRSTRKQCGTRTVLAHACVLSDLNHEADPRCGALACVRDGKSCRTTVWTSARLGLRTS